MIYMYIQACKAFEICKSMWIARLESYYTSTSGASLVEIIFKLDGFGWIEDDENVMLCIDHWIYEAWLKLTLIQFVIYSTTEQRNY